MNLMGPIFNITLYSRITVECNVSNHDFLLQKYERFYQSPIYITKHLYSSRTLLMT